MPFRDRVDAGRRLAARLEHLRAARPVVLALPRGGVPVAAEVARALGAPLDVVLVRKLGVPTQPELGMGALGEDGVRVLNREVVRAAGVSEAAIARVEEGERAELERRAARYRRGRSMLSLAGRTAVVVDDGVATGSTARAAIEVVRAHGAARVVLAVPVAPPDTVAALADVADEVVAVETPDRFWAIGAWYQDFRQTTDDEVVACLDRSAGAAPPPRAAGEQAVEIRAGAVVLPGDLAIPEPARGIVVFAHGSGSGRLSPRNREVARTLYGGGFATLLVDLLTEGEAADPANVFDVPLLAGRFAAATGWAAGSPATRGLPIGAFGASTGAAAALWAAAEPGSPITAVVSRGGRPDLAGPRLPAVRVPTLLVVGGADRVVLDLNRDAAARLAGTARVVVVAGATHLFEEPGALEQVAHLARDWFAEYLPGAA